MFLTGIGPAHNLVVDRAHYSEAVAPEEHDDGEGKGGIGRRGPQELDPRKKQLPRPQEKAQIPNFPFAGMVPVNQGLILEMLPTGVYHQLQHPEKDHQAKIKQDPDNLQ